MKSMRFLLILAMAIGLLPSAELQAQTCCDPATPTATFASLGSQESFRTAHSLPRDTVVLAPEGTDVRFLTPDGGTAGGYYLPAEAPSGKYLLVFHEWWGLNDHVKSECQRLHLEMPDVNVLAIDLYDGQVATTREDAASFMQAVKQERAEAIIRGALHNVGPDAQIATIGWCFGGGWSLQAGILAGSQAQSVVIYYGMPEDDQERLSLLEADVLGIFAGKDQWINAKVVTAFEGNMKAAGKSLETKTFDAEHAFANPTRDVYDDSAALEANQMAREFIRNHWK